MKNYLVAIDLSDEGSWVGTIAAAISMATGTEDAKIYLMTVIPGIVSGIDYRYAIRGEMQGSEEYPLQSWKEQAAVRLTEIADEQVPEALRTGVIVENGTVYKEIVEAAKDLDIDQIVMGAHRPSLADFLLGHNADKVARHAECSVTVVRKRSDS